MDLAEMKSEVSIPWWLKVCLGIAGLVVSWKVFPVVELLSLFFYVVMIPLAFMASAGLIADGVFEAFNQSWKEVLTKASDKAGEMADKAPAREVA